MCCLGVYLYVFMFLEACSTFLRFICHKVSVEIEKNNRNLDLDRHMCVCVYVCL